MLLAVMAVGLAVVIEMGAVVAVCREATAASAASTAEEGQR